MQEAFAIGFANVVGAFFRHDFYKLWDCTFWNDILPSRKARRERSSWYLYYAMSSKYIFDPRENFQYEADFYTWLNFCRAQFLWSELSHFVIRQSFLF